MKPREHPCMHFGRLERWAGRVGAGGVELPKMMVSGSRWDMPIVSAATLLAKVVAARRGGHRYPHVVPRNRKSVLKLSRRRLMDGQNPTNLFQTQTVPDPEPFTSRLPWWGTRLWRQHKSRS